jgi:hypothetical protein
MRSLKSLEFEICDCSISNPDKLLNAIGYICLIPFEENAVDKFAWKRFPSNHFLPKTHNHKAKSRNFMEIYLREARRSPRYKLRASTCITISKHVHVSGTPVSRSGSRHQQQLEQRCWTKTRFSGSGFSLGPHRTTTITNVAGISRHAYLISVYGDSTIPPDSHFCYSHVLNAIST